MRTFASVDDLLSALGTHLGHSGWHTIDQRQIDAFAAATGDSQWIHVDPARAADGPFGSTIAHGYLTLSLIPALVNEIQRIDGFSMVVNYGADKVRFPLPVTVGSRVRAGVELRALTPSRGGHLLSSMVTLDVAGATKPACLVEMLALLVP